MNSKFLWEILVPCVRNDGRPFRLRYHKIWDEKVKAISGGLTVMKPARGQWIDPETNDEYHDRTIPVRFIADMDQMDKIVNMTCIYYEQLAILCYRISDYVVLRSIEDAQANKKG